MTDRARTLLVFNGACLLMCTVATGWLYMFFLLGEIDLWPVIQHVDAQVPGDRRAWNMAHMEAITNGLILIAIALAAPFTKLSPRQYHWLFYSALTFAWLFTLPAIANALYGTRGLAFGGGPFGDSLANNVIYLIGWPPVVAVHIALGLLVLGVWKHLQALE